MYNYKYSEGYYLYVFRRIGIMKKSFAAILMIAVLVFSLAGCGGSSDDAAKD